MSYTIAIAVGPFPDTKEAAWEWLQHAVENEDQYPPEVYHHFINAITARHPCICDLSDEELEEIGVWSDGPLRNNITREVPVLGIVWSKVDEVLPFLIEEANKLGLTVFDWQTGTIHRPGSVSKSVGR